MFWWWFENLGFQVWGARDHFCFCVFEVVVESSVRSVLRLSARVCGTMTPWFLLHC
ncbi:hypothetical protein KC19_1G031200 [Ceratodon purpureus]|uniref:Uncharacterized protein n=1 Tax=Ceratodon purpureus TaxID=3225 RepID=A0A8T0J215_CERPU|nr:hypothetical protein KC19_1G031200 [Ceratodon purpureus]